MALVTVKKTYDNTSTEVISINIDKLRHKLDNNLSKAKRSKDWIGGLSLVVTVAATLLTSEFSDLPFIKGTEICFLFKILLVFSILYLVYCLWNTIFNNVSVDSMIEDMKQ